MSNRIRKPEIRLVSPDTSAHAEPPPPLPLLASSLFCDDVRQESNGKLLLIGCYPGNVILAEPNHPIDRLWIVTKLTWLPLFDATGLRLRVDLPAQQPGHMPVQTNTAQTDGMANGAVCVWHLRFHPLRPGDILRVSVEHVDDLMTCGEILAVAPGQTTRH